MHWVTHSAEVAGADPGTVVGRGHGTTCKGAWPCGAARPGEERDSPTAAGTGEVSGESSLWLLALHLPGRAGQGLPPAAVRAPTCRCCVPGGGRNRLRLSHWYRALGRMLPVVSLRDPLVRTAAGRFIFSNLGAASQPQVQRRNGAVSVGPERYVRDPRWLVDQITHHPTRLSDPAPRRGGQRGEEPCEDPRISPRGQGRPWGAGLLPVPAPKLRPLTVAVPLRPSQGASAPGQRRGRRRGCPQARVGLHAPFTL